MQAFIEDVDARLALIVPRTCGRAETVDVPHPPRHPVLEGQVTVQDARGVLVLSCRRRPRRGVAKRTAAPASISTSSRDGRWSAAESGCHGDELQAIRAALAARPAQCRRHRARTGVPPALRRTRRRGDAAAPPARIRGGPPRRRMAPVPIVHRRPDADRRRGAGPHPARRLERDIEVLRPLVRWLNAALGHSAHERRL